MNDVRWVTEPCAFCGAAMGPLANVRQTNPYDPLHSKTMHVRCFHLYAGTPNPFDQPIQTRAPWWKRLFSRLR